MARLAALGHRGVLDEVDPRPLLDVHDDSVNARVYATLGAVCLAIAESRPIEDEATSPVRWKAAERYAASSTARIVPAPVAAKTAATKAGVHAHIPNSSQEWNVYPRIKRMAGRFFSTAAPKRTPGRGG